MGILLGSKAGNTVTVTDVVPLFHERVMASAMEVAFEMVDAMC